MGAVSTLVMNQRDQGALRKESVRSVAFIYRGETRKIMPIGPIEHETCSLTFYGHLVVDSVLNFQ